MQKNGVICLVSMFPSWIMSFWLNCPKKSIFVESRHSEATKNLYYIVSTHWGQIPTFLDSNSRTVSEPLKLSLMNLILNKIINSTFAITWSQCIVVLRNCLHYNCLMFFNYLFIFCNILNGLGTWVFT